MKPKLQTFLSCLLLALAPSLASAAEAYPTRAIRIVAPFGPGGVSDSAARIVGRALEKTLGQPVVIENKPGGDGSIAATTVKNAAPDGYTILYATSGVLSTPLVLKSAGFDPIADFAPISTVGRFPYAMFIGAEVPAATVKEFVAYARARPGQLNYGTINSAEHLAAASFIKATGVDMVRIPFRQSPMSELMGGRIQVYFGPVGLGLAQAKEGRVRLLATLVPERTPLTPDVPTIAEAGVAGITAGSTYQMFLAPARTPRDVVEKLSRAVNAAVTDPEVRAQLEKVSLVAEGMTPAQLTKLIAEANVTWTQFFLEAGVVPQ